jgi:FeS assembly SUF system regulator
MIKLSKLSDYGVMLMTELARRHGQGSLTARDLAGELALPQPTVSKLLKLLAKSDLLDSQRGVKGGYSLARDPETIDLAEILAALEGPVSMTACVDGDCAHLNSCNARSSWHWINQRVIEALREVTLADMGGSPTMNPVRSHGKTSAVHLEIEGR